MNKLIQLIVVVCFGVVARAAPADAASVCDPDGLQASGSIYRICMPSSGYNGMLVVWAHGFQSAQEPVSIPEDQLCLNGFCLNELINDLGFGFATNSYRKTGLAILEGKADIVDLVSVFTAAKGRPRKVYLVGASEGGLITALNLEQRPDVFSAGLAACGPVGNFPYQINYFGDARLTFEYFFPGVIPGDPLRPDPGLVAIWSQFYEQIVRPYVFSADRRDQLNQWLAVAQLPFDATNFVETAERSVSAVLKYGVVDVDDGVRTLQGWPFDNRSRWYYGSRDDFALNAAVRRVSADPAAARQMERYNTTGALRRPLITLHTLRDEQIPFFHEFLYDLKTWFTGSLFLRHLNIPIDRHGHCNFTRDEALFAFAVTLFYDGLIDLVSGTSSILTPEQLTSFEARARSVGLPTRRSGATVAVRFKDADTATAAAAMDASASGDGRAAHSEAALAPTLRQE